MKLCRTKKQKIWTLIIVVYNALGLISILGMYPQDLFYSRLSVYFQLLSMPISLGGFIYRLLDSDSLYPVFIIQGIVFIISILFINDITKENR